MVTLGLCTQDEDLDLCVHTNGSLHAYIRICTILCSRYYLLISTRSNIVTVIKCLHALEWVLAWCSLAMDTFLRLAGCLLCWWGFRLGWCFSDVAKHLTCFNIYAESEISDWKANWIVYCAIAFVTFMRILLCTEHNWIHLRLFEIFWDSLPCFVGTLYHQVWSCGRPLKLHYKMQHPSLM